MLDYLQPLTALDPPEKDIMNQAPDLTIEEARKLQRGLMRRRIEKGDKMLGYKAGRTNRRILKAANWTGPAPMVGTLLHSLLRKETDLIVLDPGVVTLLEPEVAVVLKRDLVGPGLSNHEVLAAVEGYIPAFEIAVVPPGFVAGNVSTQHLIATHKTSGGVVLGSTMHSPYGIDLRTEGVTLTVDGNVHGTGTAVEVYGNPLTVVARLADSLAQDGEYLRAGEIIWTGTICPPASMTPGGMSPENLAAMAVYGSEAFEGHPHYARADFSRLGSVSLHFAPV